MRLVRLGRKNANGRDFDLGEAGSLLDHLGNGDQIRMPTMGIQKKRWCHGHSGSRASQSQID